MNSPDDRPLDWFVARLLQFGVGASAFVLLLSGSVYLYRHGAESLASQTPDLRAPFTPVDEKYTRPTAMFHAIGRGEARPLIQVGVLVLIATPLMRVLFTAAAFARRRDWVYVAFPLVVLLVLVIGLTLGQFDR